MPRLTKRLVEKTAADSARDLFLWDDKLAGFGLRIYPSGKRIYVYQYRTRDGRPRRATIGQHGPMTTESARQMAERMYSEVRNGGDPAGDKYAARKALKMAELCDRYLTEHAEQHKKPRSLELDRRLIERFVRPRLGNLKVQQVSRQDVGKLHRSIKHTPYQANHVLILLSKMMNLAERWGLRPDGSNPCRHIERFPQRARDAHRHPINADTDFVPHPLPRQVRRDRRLQLSPVKANVRPP